MAVKAFDKEKESFIKIASLQSRDIAVDKSEFVSDNVNDALSELKRDMKSMQSNIAWIYNNGTIGGGGGSGTGSAYTGIIQVENFDTDNYLILSDTDAATVTFKIASKLNNAFAVTLVVGSTTKTVSVQPNVSTTVNFGQLASGTYAVKITATDYTGYPTEAWNGYIIKGALSITSPFVSGTLVGLKDPVYIYYTVTTSEQLKNREHYVTYSLDGGEEITLNDTVLNKQMLLTINKEQAQMAMGVHKVVIKAGIQVNKLEYITVSKTFEFSAYSDAEIYIGVPSSAKVEYLIEQAASIPFNVVASATNVAKGFTINWAVYDGITTTGAVKESGTVSLLDVTNGYVHLSLTSAKGYVANQSYTIKLEGIVNNSTIATTTPCTFTFKVVAQATNVAPLSVVDDQLIGYYNAFNDLALSNERWINESTNVAQYNPGDCIVVNPVSNPFPENLGDTAAEELNFLKIWGKSYAYVDFNIFEQSLQKTGTTIEFVYRCKENGDPNATVASYGLYNSDGTTATLVEGFCVTANEVQFRYSDVAIPETYVMENEWIHCSMVFEPIPNTSGLFLKVYLNGVLSAFQALKNAGSSNADNTTIVKQFGKLCLGAKHYYITEEGVTTEMVDSYSDSEFRNLKIYSKALTAREIVVNYIADEYYMHFVDGQPGQWDGERNAELRKVNAINDNGEFLESSSELPKIYIIPQTQDIANNFRVMSESTGLADNAADTQYPCHIRYENLSPAVATARVSYNSLDFASEITDGYIKVQGTTSLQYNHKNYDICFGKWVDGNTEVLFTPKYGQSNLDLNASGAQDTTKNWLPENIFTLKADLIDSSHANNVGTANAISSISTANGLDSILPPKTDNNNENAAAVKYAIDGFPCLVYVYDNADVNNPYFSADNPGTASFYGVYMFDLGRTTVNNFGMQNLKINSWVEDKNGFAPCLVKDYTITTPVEGELYAKENTFSFEGNANAAGEDSNSSLNFMTTDLAQIQKDWSLRFPIKSDVVATVSNLAYNSLQIPISRAYNYASDRDAFTDGTWNQTACVVYLLCAYIFGMADNLGKNLLLRTWGKTSGDMTEWFPMFYDMDTVLGVGNTGRMDYDTNLDLDEYGDGQANYQYISIKPTEDCFFDLNYGAEGGAGHGKGLYNTPDSRLWNAVRSNEIWYGKKNGEEFDSGSLREAYRVMRANGTLTYEKLWGFYEKVTGKIGQMFYNRDAEVKYLDENIIKNAGAIANEYTYENFDKLHGTRELLTKRWLRDRLHYLDSLFDMGTSGIATNTAIWSRHNISSGATLTTGIKTKCPVFVKNEQGDDKSTIIGLCDKHYFSNFALSEGVQSNNTNIRYYCASLFSYIRGLSTGITEAEFIGASNLLEIYLPGTTILTKLTLSSLSSLRVLNVTDSTALQGNLDLSSALFLNDVNISNTKVSGISLPIGGTLTSLNASNTALTSLDVVSQTMLETLDLSNCTELNSIRLTECDSLKELIITGSKLISINITKCPSLEKIVLANNNSLKSIVLRDCENVKTVDLTGCRNMELAKYVEGSEQSNYDNAVNLASCVNLEELILTNCTANVINLSSKCTSLKKLTANNSSLIQTFYTTDTGYDVQNVTVTRSGSTVSLPTVDLSRFSNLEDITFKGAASLKAIIGLNYAGPCEGIFLNCTNLYTVQGSLTIKENCTSTFRQIGSQFRLCEGYSSVPVAGTVISTPTLNISIENTVTSLTYMFGENYGITLYDAYYFCSKLPGSLVQSSYMFASTSLQRTATGYQNEIVNPAMLKTCSGLKIATGMFQYAVLYNTFPSRILQYCSALTDVSAMFLGNGFNMLDADFSTSLFDYTPHITNCASFLYHNPSLKTNVNSPVYLDKIFAKLEGLTNCSNFLGVYRTLSSSSNSIHHTDDGWLDTFARRTLYLSFTASNQTDKLFANNPKLTNCFNAFSKCTFASGAVLSKNMFGGVSSDSCDDGTSAAFPSGLINASYLFHDSNASLVLDEDLFKNLKKLENISGFVSGGYSSRTATYRTISRCDLVTGNIADLGNLFAYNTALTHVNRFFEATGVTGQVPTSTATDTASTLFAQNISLQEVDHLFRNSKISGSIPNLLFGKCSGLTSARSVFMGCTGLTGALPGQDDSSIYIFKCLNSSDNTYQALKRVDDFFNGCTSITSRIPTNLFEYTPKLTHISGFFRGCGSSISDTVGIIGSIPTTLFSPLSELTYAEYFFSGCYGLSEDASTSVFVPNNLFSNSGNYLKSLKGLFQYVPVTTVEAGAFEGLSFLEDISYMFAYSNRTNLVIPESTFANLNRIKNISYFVGDSSSFALLGSGMATFYQWFTPFNANNNSGQYRLDNISYAFCNNPNAVWADENKTMDFWDTTVWQTSASSYTGCYEDCDSLQNEASIPDGYK